MKRGVFDTLRRGLDNSVANWHLTLIRFLESVAFGIILVISVFAILIPIFVSIGIEGANIDTPEDIEGAVFRLVERWWMLIWIFLGISVLLLIFVAVHSWVEAGCARILVDGDRVAGPETQGPRSRYAVFSMERFLAGARDGWWGLFWIYNVAWGIAGLILLIPLLPTAALMLVFRERPPALIATGCIGLVLTGLLGLGVMIVTGVWTNRAIAGWAVRRSGAADALRAAWAAFKADFVRHILIALAILVIGFAAGTFIGSMSMFASVGQRLGDSGAFLFFAIPIRIFATLVNWAVTAMISNWFLGSYAAIAVESSQA